MHRTLDHGTLSNDAAGSTILLQQASAAVVCEPLSIAALAAFLRAKGYSCRMVQFSEDVDVRELVKELMGKNPLLIGISVLSHANRALAKSILSALDSDSETRCPTCVGGYEPSLSPQDWYGMQGLDLIVQGEGELPLLAIVAALAAGDRRVMAAPPPGVLSAQGLSRSTRGGRVADLDSLPFPSREALPMRGGRAVGEVGIVSGRGCYARCAFCAVHHFARLDTGKAFRQRSVANVVREMVDLHRNYGAKDYYFYDDVFTLPGKHGALRAAAFKEAIMAASLDITFGIYQRPDCVTPEILRPLVECGLNRVFVGIESFSDDDLRYFAKGATAAAHVHAMETFEDFGFSPEPGAARRIRVGMIPFHPFSSRASLRDNVETCARFRIPPKRLTLRLEIYPHTQSERDASAAGLLNGDYSWEYENREVSWIEAAFSSIMERYVEVREPIREIEKAAPIAQLSLDPELAKCREAIDRETLETMAQMLEVRHVELDREAIIHEYENRMGRIIAPLSEDLRRSQETVTAICDGDEAIALDLRLSTSNVFDQSHFRRA